MSQGKEKEAPVKHKNGNGIRLVQRKFAQGVPIPHSMHTVPPAPEKRAEPPKEDPKTVYHTSMTARSLLDVVALQSVHRHKQQPLVLLERLREDEIPATPPVPPPVPIPKKRGPKPKNVNKNMCLRPRPDEAPEYGRKRKNTNPIKGPSKKRICDDRSSTTDDDMPLLYLRNKPKQKIADKRNDAHEPFKRPPNITVMDMRRFRRSRSSTPSLIIQKPGISGRKILRSTAPQKGVRRSRRRVGRPAVYSPSPRRALRPRPWPAKRIIDSSRETTPSSVQEESSFDPSHVAGPSRAPLPGTPQLESRSRETTPRLAQEEASREPSPVAGPSRPMVTIPASVIPNCENWSCETTPPLVMEDSSRKPSPVAGPSGLQFTLHNTLPPWENWSLKEESSREPCPVAGPSGLQVTLPTSRKPQKCGPGSAMRKSTGQSALPPTENWSLKEESSLEPSPVAGPSGLQVTLPTSRKPQKCGPGSAMRKSTGQSALPPTENWSLKEESSREPSPVAGPSGLQVTLPTSRKPQKCGPGSAMRKSTGQSDTSEESWSREASPRLAHEEASREPSPVAGPSRLLMPLPTSRKPHKCGRGSAMRKSTGQSVKRTIRLRTPETSRSPIRNGPTSRSPINNGPTSRSPIYNGPTSRSPLNIGPTSRSPLNIGPTSRSPLSIGPTSRSPLNIGPTSRSPLNIGPTSRSPNHNRPPTEGRPSNSASPPEPRGQPPCACSRYRTIEEIVMAAAERSEELRRLRQHCVDDVEQFALLVKPVSHNPESVYDFNNEHDDVACPSLSRLRDIRRLARGTEEESYKYLDILPKPNPHLIKIICKGQAGDRAFSSARLLTRDATPSTNGSNLIERQHPMDSLLESMGTADRQILNAQQQETPEEPQPSTSQEYQVGEQVSRNTDSDIGADTVELLNRAAPPVADQPEPSPPRRVEEPPRPASADNLEADVSEDDADKFLNGSGERGAVLDAPVFRPTPEEFQDPIAYFKKIEKQASGYGLCKIIPPPDFKPPCNMNDYIRFAVVYQYISKLYNRWGPVGREITAIKAYLRTQSVVFKRLPLLEGSEINLSKLYHSVERNGGATEVIQKKCWQQVAEDMKLTGIHDPVRKLDSVYIRFLLPYATLSKKERQHIMSNVESYWARIYQKMLYRARNPFHRQMRLLGECSSSDDDTGDGDIAGALHEAEDCIVPGRVMNLATFKKIANILMETHFDSDIEVGTEEIEKAYWRNVLLGTEHIVASTASIDTGEEGYGFPKDQTAEYGAHPWNLKMLAKNPKNVLHFLGPVLGVTVPTLHIGMLFSTSCWHRDPHGLPWIEFMHAGPEKIWYGIPSSQSGNFRSAVETLCPAYCQNKSIWLASDIAMIPPDILSAHHVRLSRLTQQPGEYVLVFPEAYSCSITTGYCVSESVYFATENWLETVYVLFQELRNSCEPTMFSLVQLLINGSEDPDAPRRMLLPICSVLGTLLSAELEHRRLLHLKGIMVRRTKPHNTSRVWNARDQDECYFCRCTLYISKVVGLGGKKTTFCPEHAIRLLETRKHKHFDTKRLSYLSPYGTETIEKMIENLEKRTADL